MKVEAVLNGAAQFLIAINHNIGNLLFTKTIIGSCDRCSDCRNLLWQALLTCLNYAGCCHYVNIHHFFHFLIHLNGLLPLAALLVCGDERVVSEGVGLHAAVLHLRPQLRGHTSLSRLRTHRDEGTEGDNIWGHSSGAHVVKQVQRSLPPPFRLARTDERAKGVLVGSDAKVFHLFIQLKGKVHLFASLARSKESSEGNYIRGHVSKLHVLTYL
mmetsp:Transcript_25581/g.35315  ORF Transcript_25581/g.35315 Transcript_25581/m.35315 type:complete len:214 (-) Transcript_25581:999-1640(-)